MTHNILTSNDAELLQQGLLDLARDNSVGQSCFEYMVATLAKLVNVKYSLIGRLKADNPYQIETMAVYVAGQIVENISYSLIDTPCARVIVDNKICFYESGLAALFPQNPALTQMGIESYVGIPIRNSKGNALGIIVLEDEKPLFDSPEKRILLEAFATRASTEMEHVQTELQLRELNTSLENDIILRKQAEEERDQFLRLSIDMIGIASKNGYFKKINPAFKKILGYSYEEFISRPFIDFVHPDDVAATLDAMKSLEENKPMYSFENRYRCKDGSFKWLEWNTTTSGEDLYCIARDITEHKKNEELIKSSEEKYRRIFETMADAYLLANIEGVVQSVNPAMVKLLGYDTAEEMIGLITSKDLYANNQDRAKAISLLKEQGRLKNYFLCFKSKNGELVYTECNIHFLYNENGLPVAVEGTIRDITERRKAEEELLHIQRQLKETNQVARVGGWEVDLVRDEVHWTAVTKEIHEVPQDYIPTRSEIINFYLEGENRDKIIHSVAESIKNRKSWDMELKIITAKGNERWVRAKGSSEFVGDICVRIFGIFQDIHEQKLIKDELKKEKEKAEQYLMVAEAILVAFDTEAKISLINRKGTQILGYEEQELIGKDWFKICLAPEDYEEVSTVFRRLMAGEVQPFEYYENHIITKTGKKRYIAWHNSVTKDEEGNITGTFSFGEDITERKLAELQIELQNRELQKTNSELDRFVYSASHELRAPLASLLGLINIAKYDERDYSKLILFDRMQKSIQGLDHFITDIIHYSRNSRLMLEHEIIDFEQLLIENIESLRFMKETEFIKIEHKVLGEYEFYSDKKRISILLRNFLSNAIKYYDVSKKQPFIQIWVNIDQEGAHLEIKDNGIGISEEYLNKIFDMFYRATTHSSGSGLGLFIVKEIIDKMSGQIRVSSAEGEGTSFFIDIPNSTLIQ